ncbi:DUF7336 domain-containing protein [Bradyrhizobium sp. CCBAU 51745]|uniref:DUF7336 domain-containing protein n=1 Tax=Bradyrhizobium sp. CCBAU 51745 TaxID=1325099 RepID=UPI0023066D00|nr:hypothetical protein [Bradyrhizobium sp. CCBAU 51745]
MDEHTIEQLDSMVAGAFAVFHSYEEENGDEHTKFIGIFSTKESAEAAVGVLKKMQGFADYPLGFQ